MRQQCESKDILGDYNEWKMEAATGSLDNLRHFYAQDPCGPHMQNSATAKTDASQGPMCLIRPMVTNIFRMNYMNMCERTLTVKLPRPTQMQCLEHSYSTEHIAICV